MPLAFSDYKHRLKLTPEQVQKIKPIMDQAGQDIRAARQVADVVLVSHHWGIHFVRASIADYQREVARAAVAAVPVPAANAALVPTSTS